MGRGSAQALSVVQEEASVMIEDMVKKLATDESDEEFTPEVLPSVLDPELGELHPDLERDEYGDLTDKSLRTIRVRDKNILFRELKRMSQREGLIIFKKYLRLAAMGELDHELTFKILQEALNRGFGKPVQQVDASVDVKALMVQIDV